MTFHCLTVTSEVYIVGYMNANISVYERNSFKLRHAHNTNT